MYSDLEEICLNIKGQLKDFPKLKMIFFKEKGYISVVFDKDTNVIETLKEKLTDIPIIGYDWDSADVEFEPQGPLIGFERLTTLVF